jgi:hypothetical protein
MISITIYGLACEDQLDLMQWGHVHYPNANIKHYYDINDECHLEIKGTLSECAGICAHLETL